MQYILPIGNADNFCRLTQKNANIGDNNKPYNITFSNFSCRFINPKKYFWPFTVWINCSSDLKNFANSRPSASNFKKCSRSLAQFFLTGGQNNFGNKIPITTHKVQRTQKITCQKNKMVLLTFLRKYLSLSIPVPFILVELRENAASVGRRKNYIFF